MISQSGGGVSPCKKKHRRIFGGEIRDPCKSRKLSYGDRLFLPMYVKEDLPSEVVNNHG